MTMRLQRRRFSVNEYRQMAETGILSPRDRVELIRGEIVEMSPIGRRQAACVRRLIRLLARLVGDRALLEEYREPTPTGYRVVQQYGRGEMLSIQELSGIAIAVNDVLG